VASGNVGRIDHVPGTWFNLNFVVTVGYYAAGDLHKRMLPNSFSKIASRLSPSARFLLGIWSTFFLLVAFGIHGAPTPRLVDVWSKRPYTGYVFGPLAEIARKRNLGSESLDQFLMTVAPTIRGDDAFIRFPLALSQLSHGPRFPVINTNYWNGTNMLAQSAFDEPVWHISALARPGTWGYFFLGTQRGVAWQWWFQIFGCFTVLYLLLAIILDRDRRLAAFGSFWFCGSAGVACFGYWPTYVTFYAALAVLCAYWLLKSGKRWIQVICGALLGLAVAGFAMILYPPWQIPLGYLFLLILVGLIVRDKLYFPIRSTIAWKVLSIGIAVVIGGLILVTYLTSSWADLKVMADTVYPGNRRTNGGVLPFWRLFCGAYNLLTSFQGYYASVGVGAGATRPFLNETESSLFYLLFPALLAPLSLSKRWRKSFGVIGWLLAGYLAFVLMFIKVGLPGHIAAMTLFNRTHGTRVVLAVGLISIILCLRAIQCAQSARANAPGKLDKALPALAALIIIPIIAGSGLFMAAANNGVPAAQYIVLAALAGASASYFMVAGRARAFCALIAVALLPIPWAFNCLSTNLDYIYKTELAAKIGELDKQSGAPPLWVCYDGAGTMNYLGVLVSTLGGRSVSGVQWPPDLKFWHSLDPSRAHEEFYNRFAHVFLHYTDDENVSYSNPSELVLDVTIRADNPVLKQMGAKYILAFDAAARQVNTDRFPLLYKSPTSGFSIFEIP
jgi:hypothetical protein